jgi:hypothetical protein
MPAPGFRFQLTCDRCCLNYFSAQGNVNRTRCDIIKSFTNFIPVADSGKDQDFVFNVYRKKDPKRFTRLKLLALYNQSIYSTITTRFDLQTLNQNPLLNIVQRYPTGFAQHKTREDTEFDHLEPLLSAFVSARFP